MSATDVAIQKKMYGNGTKRVEFSNKDLEDMTKIVKALEDSLILCPHRYINERSD